MEPFPEMRPAQVIGVVPYREERPKMPEGASASPDVVRLMERCWMQDPAQRPEGFVPVVQELASVVKRVGDPRNRSPAAQDATSSPGAKRSGFAPSVAASTAPLTDSGSLHASSLYGMSVEGPTAATASPPAPPERDASTDRSVLEGLYNATGGPSWTNRKGWGESTVPLGEWHGVTVDGEDRG